MADVGLGGHGKITRGVKAQTLTNTTIKFIELNLPRWRDDPTRKNESAEERLNSQLCKFLEVKSRTELPMVHFSHEEFQTDRRRIDLAALQAETHTGSIYDPFLVIECKRLPAPASSREREYLTGAKCSGGIQRFKLNLHGAGFATAVLIGYVQSNSIDYWFQTINGWIVELASAKSSDDGCTWTTSENLRKFSLEAASRMARCNSVHGRVGKSKSDSIEIFHLWIEM